jgi:hypothetical protein
MSLEPLACEAGACLPVTVKNCSSHKILHGRGGSFTDTSVVDMFVCIDKKNDLFIIGPQ